MNWNKLNTKIENSDGYKFFKKYERVTIVIQGFIVIGLLIGIALFFIQDYQVKEQIKDRCGYTTDTYECVCDASYVKNFKDLQEGRDIIFDNIYVMGSCNGTTEQVEGDESCVAMIRDFDVSFDK